MSNFLKEGIFAYLSDLDEASTTILLHIKIKSLRLNLQALGGELLLRLVVRLTCEGDFNGFIEFENLIFVDEVI